MPEYSKQITFKATPEMAEYIKSCVDDNRYKSQSKVCQAAIELLMDNDEECMYNKMMEYKLKYEKSRQKVKENGKKKVEEEIKNENRYNEIIEHKHFKNIYEHRYEFITDEGKVIDHLYTDWIKHWKDELAEMELEQWELKQIIERKFKEDEERCTQLVKELTS